MSQSFDVAALRRDNPLSALAEQRGVKLKRNGREWKSCCPFHAEKSPSFTIYPGADGIERFRCFGCDAGGDVIEFVSRLDGVPFAEACRRLGSGEISTARPRPQPLPAAPDPYADWRATMPPADAPQILPGQRTPPLFNPKSDERPVTTYTPTMVHPYRFRDGRIYAYVLRVPLAAGKKMTPTIAWCVNEKTGQAGWCHYKLSAPRKLYGIDRLAENPDAPVVVVEGEKCTDALQAALPDHVVVSWNGGGKAAWQTDFSPLAGRSVTIWGDRDPEFNQTLQGWRRSGGEWKPGLLELIPVRCRVARPDAIQRAKGWDCADAIAEGWTGEQIVAWLDAQTAERAEALITTEQQQPRPEPEPAPERPRPRQIPGTNVVAIAGGNVPGTPYDWRANLKFDKHGKPEKKNPTNWFLFLRHHPKFEGMFALNTFTNTITVRRRPPWDDRGGAWQERGLTDDDQIRCALELDSYETGELQVSHEGMGRTISSVAEAQRFNPVADYLRGLQWDGVDRLYGGDKQDGWLCHYFGAEPLTYHRTVGMRWLIAGAARALSDGGTVEKVDTMLILEGPQGYFKSTALEILATLDGRRMYTDSVDSFQGKDAAMQTNGVLIVEIAELVGMTGRNVDAVKKWMSSKVDRYRPPYGKNVIEAPRRFIVAATVNPNGPGYLHDATGARRFWPVACGRPCDLTALERDRDQLWAEAVHRFLAGEQWWLKPDEVPDAEYQAGKRYHDDPWAGRLDFLMQGAAELTLQACFEGISMPLHRASAEDKRRVADHMKARGWVTIRDGKGERWARG